MLNKADATRLRLLVAIKSRALTLVSASGASVVDVLLMHSLTNAAKPDDRPRTNTSLRLDAP